MLSEFHDLSQLIIDKRTVRQTRRYWLQEETGCLLVVSVSGKNARLWRRRKMSQIKRASYSSCLRRASIVLKTLFIVPTDAHYYKIIEMLKQFKIIKLAATCFGSRRNHHQGAVLCLAKTTKWFFCARTHACTTGWYAAVTMTASIPTSTEKPFCSFC